MNALPRNHGPVSRRAINLDAAGEAWLYFEAVAGAMRQAGHDIPLREQLRTLFDRAKLPTNPAIAARVLELVNDRDSTAGQFARVIENDPALAARLLKMGNSALFTTRHPVSTIQRAVTVLGLRRIRMAAVSFQLVAHLDQLGGVHFRLSRFWQQSVLRACLARAVAKKAVPGHAEEAFLVGLLQDCGIVLLAQLQGEEYAALYRDGNLTPTAFLAEERKRFRYNHVEVIEVMADEWRLPEHIKVALAAHHAAVRLSGHAGETDRLRAVSYFVGSMNLAAGNSATSAEPRLLEYARSELQIDPDELEAIFADVARSYQEVATLFGEVLPADVDVTDLLMEANQHLSRAASASDLHALEVEAERDRYQQERHTLRHAVAQYREKAARDPLTGVLNRGALLESAVGIMREAESNGSAVAVFFLDIDNFKKFNDDHGHQTGDKVLRLVARVAMESARNAGVVGRYGGEEFVVVTAGLGRDETARYAERLVRAIRHMEIAELGLSAPVTCSLGAVWGRSTDTPQALFTRADQLMYEAKRAGKDRVVFRPLEEIDELALASDDATMARLSGAAHSAIAAGSTTLDRLRAVAARLNENDTDEFLNARKQPRRALIAPCRFSFLTGPSLEVRTEDACLRNISAGGVGLVFSHAMVRGDLVEIRIDQPDGALYAAGLVAFCRHIETGVFEIGIQAINNARQPIISENPVDAIERLNWVARAVQEKYGADIARRKSA